MTLSLHNRKSVKNVKSAKRIGRGPGSGKGTYSAKGLKGQRARTGSRSGLKRLGMKPNIASIPKLPGFKSQYKKMVIVNLSTIDKHFNDGEKVNIEALHRKGLITTKNLGLKVLGDGTLTKKVTIVADKASEGAVKAIEKAGAKIKLIKSGTKSAE